MVGIFSVVSDMAIVFGRPCSKALGKTWTALLAHHKEERNAKEYVLILPDRAGARVDPLLPLALADIAAMSWGAVWTMSKPGFDFTRIGVRFADTTPGKLRDIISRLFIDHCGVNLNINLVNEKSREYGYLRLWSLLFHTLHQYKRTDWRSVRRTLKSRDGSQRDVEAVTHHGEPRYTYAAPHATNALVGFFDGDSGLAGAHAGVAETLANTRDWRLQFFINISESARWRWWMVRSPTRLAEAGIVGCFGDLPDACGFPGACRIVEDERAKCPTSA